MPRLPNSLIYRANRIDQHLPLLLKACRDLESAQNELRWLREHVGRFNPPNGRNRGAPPLHELCRQRATGKPLQYILGSQPFGNLDIHCRRGVLIPRYRRCITLRLTIIDYPDRPETESYTTYLAARIFEQNTSLGIGEAVHILDLCSGTGCISLLLYSLLAHRIPKLRITGVDIEPKAITLARKNLNWNIRMGHLPARARESICFKEGDIFAREDFGLKKCDILIANPPYVSPSSFDRDTSRSARNFEPKKALIPVAPGQSLALSYENPASGDIFYAAIIRRALKLKATMVLMEVAGLGQAQRILLSAHEVITKEHFDSIYKYEIWHDELPVNKDAYSTQSAASILRHGEIPFTKTGSGNARAVVLQLKADPS